MGKYFLLVLYFICIILVILVEVVRWCGMVLGLIIVILYFFLVNFMVVVILNMLLFIIRKLYFVLGFFMSFYKFLI